MEVYVLTGLLASARELRNPLTIGYSALLTPWLVAGEELNAAAQDNPLGRRLLGALDAIGEATTLALITFVAAIIGSILWHSGVARLVRFSAVRSGHPDWPALIDEAKDSVRRYEQYEMVTHKGQSFGSPSAFDERHTVPSARWGGYLHERVEERERKAAEMSWRVTLALALVPAALALGIEGGGLWWWSLMGIPTVWLDVALMKYTTLRTVRRYQLEDLQARLEQAKESLAAAERAPDYGTLAEEQREQQEGQRRQRIEELQGSVRELEATILLLTQQSTRRLPRLFAFVEGQPAE